jgi:hypothetical protein
MTFYAMGLLFIIGIQITNPNTKWHFPLLQQMQLLQIVFSSLFIYFSVLFVSYAINYKGWVPFSNFLQFLGIYSYSAYLFCDFYWYWGINLGFLSKNSFDIPYGLINFIAFPAFFALVFLMEEVVNSKFNVTIGFRNYVGNINKFWHQK